MLRSSLSSSSGLRCVDHSIALLLHFILFALRRSIRSVVVLLDFVHPYCSFFHIVTRLISNFLIILYSDWFKKWATFRVQRLRFSSYKV